MLKILTITTVYPNPQEPGLGRFVSARLQHLAEYARIRVIAPVALCEYNRPILSWFKCLRVPIRRVEGRLAIWHPRWAFPPNGGAATVLCLVARLLWRVALESRHTDLLDAHFGFPEGVATAILARAVRLPYLITLRGSEIEHARFPLRRALLGWSCRRADRVLAVSGRLREFALSLGVLPNRVATVPNGVEKRIFHPRDRDAMRAKHVLNARSKIVLSAGNLIRLKGHHRVIAALQSLTQTYGIPAELLIVGAPGKSEDTGDELRALAQRAGLQSQVRFFDLVSQEVLAELMCAADVLCLASDREGWPNVVNEALACGTPVLATDVGAVPDLLPLSKYGRIVGCTDDEDLAETLADVLSTEWDRGVISAWGQSRTWDHVALEVFSYAEAAAKSTRDIKGVRVNG